ncbi:nucleotide pyrophosphatase [Burkholderia sp. Bp9140]|uniref:alkaline phosphatase family protein n=1 Tax=Burkholderia sp. Bp9140 TaxID=2184572 RepID=UPI000F56B0BB|nr:alkaline phosphatase family protein [Burkholderia sp. Bp9140]RQR45401.1 nucleotide pyrophosphatase [Burkholderia sp. Bp9140]
MEAQDAMAQARKVVFVCCDGLSRSWISDERTPGLARMKREGVWFDRHRAVFPSVTRVSAATIATGCLPVRHGLHGNRMGLCEAGRVVVRDVGAPDFREHMRRATGQTLKMPTLAQRVAHLGRAVAFSNVSPGAAYFLDPEHFGYVYHRAGSYGPGGVREAGTAHLDVTHDVGGDLAMTRRFCNEVLMQRKPPVAMLWLANPDLTLHGAPLGGPDHLAAMRSIDGYVQMVVRTVERLRETGEDILLLVGSDHGQETIGETVDLEAHLSSRGCERELAQGDIAVASQGTAALLYATGRARSKLESMLAELAAMPWAESVISGESLIDVGLRHDEEIVAAINMGVMNAANEFGVPGRRWIAAEPGKSPRVGDGQHGGWGGEETSPFLVVDYPGLEAGPVSARTHLADIAPTALTFLGLPVDGVDGRSLIAMNRDGAIGLASCLDSADVQPILEGS